MRMYLRGRPVVLYGPSELDTLDPAKVAPPPPNKLKLEWVYGYRWDIQVSYFHHAKVTETVMEESGVGWFRISSSKSTKITY